MPVAGNNIWSMTAYVNTDGRLVFGRQTYRPKAMVMSLEEAQTSLRQSPDITVVFPWDGTNMGELMKEFET